MNNPDIIELSWNEALVGALGGSMRRISNALKPSGSAADDWNIDIDGAMAELAVAKRFGLTWLPGVAGSCDFPGGLEARSSPKHENRLIVRPKDAERADFEQKRYLFVTGRFPTFWIRGWISGPEATHAKWWQEINNGRPAAWFIPAAGLHPPDTLVLEHPRPMF